MSAQNDDPYATERGSVQGDSYDKNRLRPYGDPPVTEEDLCQSEEQFRSVVANIPGVIYRCECVEPWSQRFISDYIEVLTGAQMDR